MWEKVPFFLPPLPVTLMPYLKVQQACIEFGVEGE